MEFYSGATALPGRFTEGFLHRRLQAYSFDITSLNATLGAIIRGVRVATLDGMTFSELYATLLRSVRRGRT